MSSGLPTVVEEPQQGNSQYNSEPSAAVAPKADAIEPQANEGTATKKDTTKISQKSKRSKNWGIADRIVIALSAGGFITFIVLAYIALLDDVDKRSSHKPMAGVLCGLAVLIGYQAIRIVVFQHLDDDRCEDNWKTYITTIVAVFASVALVSIWPDLKHILKTIPAAPVVHNPRSTPAVLLHDEKAGVTQTNSTATK